MHKMLEEIEVLNLSENEVVRHSILLIRGKITNQGRRNSENHTKQELQQICLYNGNDCLTEICENGEFKFILELTNFTALKEGQVDYIELLFKHTGAKERKLKLCLEKPQSAYRLQPIYILCADETASDLTRKHCEKIDVNLRLIQALYADRIREALGCSLTTFVINGACQTFKSDIRKAEAWSADENFLWSYFAKELLIKRCFEAEKNVKLKIVAFIGCTKYDGNSAVATGDLSYGNIRKHLRAHAALGGGDLAIFGSGFFYAWPKRVDEIAHCLRNTRKVDPTVEPDESNYRRTYLGVYATTLGAVCHELGHIFDCGHTQDGIMGSGFDFVNRLLTVTNRVENLPKRIIGNVPTTATTTTTTTASSTATKCRLTKIKRNVNGFLDNYREQRKSDCFYFERNCAVLLANNKWFKNFANLQNVAVEKVAAIQFNPVKGIITCVSQPLKIIEIRTNLNGLVDKYYEFLDSPQSRETFTYQLESRELRQFKNTHYLFVLTLGGESARFDLLTSDNENSE